MRLPFRGLCGQARESRLESGPAGVPALSPLERKASRPVPTVLIAHRNVGFASSLASILRAAEYRAIVCPGPWPPALRCIRCDVGYCPLTEGADAMIYDPDMVALHADGNMYNLALDSSRAHPDVPLLLAWPEEEPPASVAQVLAQAPAAILAARGAEPLVAQVRALIGGPYDKVGPHKLGAPRPAMAQG